MTLTTKITVEVPQDADYQIGVVTNTPPERGSEVTYLKAGERTEVLIHGDQRVTVEKIAAQYPQR